MSEPTCAVENCGKPLRARGYCNSHYIRFRTKGDPLAGGIDSGATKRWLESHANYTGDDCLTWPYARNNRGYGRTKDGLAHRRMLCLTVGDPPSPGTQAAHSCGKGHEGCCNPRHLRWATAIDNENDKREHGTDNRGTRNGQVKLTEKVVLAVVAMRQDGASYAEIQSRYSIQTQTLSSILNGHNWEWLTGIPRK